MRWFGRADHQAPWVVTFIDVAASVALYRRLGDEIAAERIAATLDEVRQRATAHDGLVIKRSGDELLVLFRKPDRAIDALIDVQRGTRLDLRIGAHRGPILRQHGDVYGDTVNLAARLTAIARARQIVLSRALFEALDANRRNQCERFERLRLKGITTPVPIYQHCWEGGAATAINTLDVTQLPTSATPVLEMVLEGFGTTLRIAGGDDALIGRDPSCDLIIDHPRVSRFHATVEFHDGQFLLRDHSTNGSLVQANIQTGGRPLRRAATRLSGKGAVRFGHTDATCTGIPNVTFLVA